MGTALGRRIELINLDKHPAVPLRFIFQLPDKLPPADITDAFSETVVLHHVLDGKTLDADHLVLVNDVRREFVLIVFAPIGNLGMQTSDFEPCLRSVLAPLFLLGKSSLCLGELFLILAEELRIADAFPFRRDHHALQAQVKPHLLIHHWQGLDILLHQDRDEVAISSILGDRDRGGLASFGQGTTPMDDKRLIHLGEGERFAVPLEGGSGIFSRLVPMAALELRVCSLSFKEVLESFFQVAKRLLGRHTGDIVEPSVIVLVFEQGEACRQLVVPNAFLPFIVRVGAKRSAQL